MVLIKFYLLWPIGKTSLIPAYKNTNIQGSIVTAYEWLINI